MSRLITPSILGLMSQRPFGGHATLGGKCIGWWKKDETSGTTVIDSLGNNDGTNTGATINQTGVNGKCYKYVDSTDFVDFGAFSALWNGSNNKASFFCRFKSDDVSAASLHNLGAKSSNYASERFLGFYSAVLGTGKIRCWVGDTGTSNYDYWDTNDAIVTSDNTWYDILITLDLSSNTCVIYVDGVAYATTLTSAGSNITTFASNAITFKIGRTRASSGAYTGMVNAYVDDYGIFNDVLTAQEAADITNDTLTY